MQRSNENIVKIYAVTTAEDIQVGLRKMPTEVQIHTERLTSELIKVILSYLSKHRHVRLSFEENDAHFFLDFQLKLEVFKSVLQVKEDIVVFSPEDLFQDERAKRNLNTLAKCIGVYCASFEEDVTTEPQAKRRKIDDAVSDKEATQTVAFSVIIINLLEGESLNDNVIKELLTLFSEIQIKSLQRFIKSLDLNKLQLLPEQINLVASSASYSASTTISATSDPSLIYPAQNNGYDLVDSGLIEMPLSSPWLFTGTNNSTVSPSMLTPNSAMPNRTLAPSPVDYSEGRRKEAVKTVQIAKVYKNPFVSGDQKQGAGQVQVLQDKILSKIASCQLESNWRTVRFFLKKDSGTRYENIDRALTVKYQSNIKISEMMESHRGSSAGLSIVFKNTINTPEEIWENMRIICGVSSANSHQISGSLKLFFEENCIDWGGSLLEQKHCVNIRLLPMYHYLMISICLDLAGQISRNGDVSELVISVLLEKNKIKVQFKHSYSSLALAYEALGKCIMGKDWEWKYKSSSVSPHYLTSATPLHHLFQGDALPMQQNMPMIPFYSVAGVAQRLPFFGNGQANSQTSMGSAVVDFNQDSAAVHLNQVFQPSLNKADNQAQAQINDSDNEKAVSVSWDPDSFFSTSNKTGEIEEGGHPSFVDDLFAPFLPY